MEARPKTPHSLTHLVLLSVFARFFRCFAVLLLYFSTCAWNVFRPSSPPACGKCLFVNKHKKGIPMHAVSYFPTFRVVDLVLVTTQHIYIV